MGPRQLTPNEVLFVGGEHPNAYYHVSGLTLLEADDSPEFGFEMARARLIEGLEHVPQFRWRLHQVPLGLDLPYWVEDEHFSFDNHIRRIAVPAPGDREALGELVAYLYSRHLDRLRPLWETWFIDGIENGQYGLFFKLHHCMMDGEAAARLSEVISSIEPNAPPRPVDPAIADAQPGDAPEPWRASLTAARHLGGLPIRATREVVGAVSHALGQLMPGSAPRQPRARAPETVFNAAISGERGFVFGSVSLTDVKAVKDHFDVTVNDVVLAVVAGSLRRYLQDRDELPDAPLRTSIAVSLRSDEDDPFSNRITTTGVTLATDVADPAARLRAIADDSTRAKERARAGGKDILEMVGILPPALVGAVTAMAPPNLVRQLSNYNLILSSVRGSPVPLYTGPARATAMYPMSIIMTGGGINVTCISYVDNIDVGMTIEPRLVPDPWRLIDGLDEELDAYRALLPKRARGKRAARP